MSIYRRPRANPENDVTAPVLSDADGGAVRKPTSFSGAAGFLHLRKSSPVNIVLPATRRWLETLPQNARPMKLAESFPRIVNLVALEWRNEIAIDRMFSDLLIDHRGGRGGFASDILQELRVLRDYRYNRPPSGG